MRARKFGAGSLLLGALLFAGCALGPEYARPPVAMPPEFWHAGPGGAEQSVADLSWWDVYQDENLRALIQEGLVDNYDALVAVSRVEQAAAIAMQARSPLFPQLGYQFDAARGGNSFLGAPALSGAAVADSFFGALNVFWEVDLWGRIRRSSEAARAQLLAAEENRRAVLLSLVSLIAQRYFELCELDREHEIAVSTEAAFAKSSRMFRDRLEQGVASAVETARAEAARAETAAGVPELERLIGLKEAELSVLLGRVPGPIARGPIARDLGVVATVPAGLPSQLLERRPDIRQAEQTIVLANADVGVAIADFFPRIGLSGFFGGVSTDLDDITSGRSQSWGLDASVNGPLFQGGNLLGRYDQAQARKDEAILLYRQTILNALREVSDALISNEKTAAALVEQRKSVAAYTDAVELAIMRYDTGKSSYFEVIDAQQLLYPSELVLARYELQQRLALVQLYQALGGGWQLDVQSFTLGEAATSAAN